MLEWISFFIIDTIIEWVIIFFFKNVYHAIKGFYRKPAHSAEKSQNYSNIDDEYNTRMADIAEEQMEMASKFYNALYGYKVIKPESTGEFI